MKAQKWETFSPDVNIEMIADKLGLAVTNHKGNTSVEYYAYDRLRLQKSLFNKVLIILEWQRCGVMD